MRFDIAIEADLIEEIVRIHGYHRLPGNRPLTRLMAPPQPEGQVALARFKDVLIQRGFQEAITYSFVDPVFQQALDPERKPLAPGQLTRRTGGHAHHGPWPGLLRR